MTRIEGLNLDWLDERMNGMGRRGVRAGSKQYNAGAPSSVPARGRTRWHGITCWREAVLRAGYAFRLWRNEGSFTTRVKCFCWHSMAGALPPSPGQCIGHANNSLVPPEAEKITGTKQSFAPASNTASARLTSRRQVTAMHGRRDSMNADVMRGWRNAAVIPCGHNINRIGFQPYPVSTLSPIGSATPPNESNCACLSSGLPSSGLPSPSVPAAFPPAGGLPSSGCCGRRGGRVA